MAAWLYRSDQHLLLRKIIIKDKLPICFISLEDLLHNVRKHVRRLAWSSRLFDRHTTKYIMSSIPSCYASPREKESISSETIGQFSPTLRRDDNHSSLRLRLEYWIGVLERNVIETRCVLCLIVKWNTFLPLPKKICKQARFWLRHTRFDMIMKIQFSIWLLIFMTHLRGCSVFWLFQTQFEICKQIGHGSVLLIVEPQYAIIVHGKRLFYKCFWPFAMDVYFRIKFHVTFWMINFSFILSTPTSKSPKGRNRGRGIREEHHVHLMNNSILKSTHITFSWELKGFTWGFGVRAGTGIDIRSKRYQLYSMERSHWK